jgi:amino acid adenylation domain-containing protein
MSFPFARNPKLTIFVKEKAMPTKSGMGLNTGLYEAGDLNLACKARDLRVHQLVSRQAEATPRALALSACSSALTYNELECRSNRLAHHLRGLGVGPDILVGLCVERSPMMVVGALAIMKAGGAYLPIDPSYPQERTALMLEDARPRVVLTQASMVPRLSGNGADIVVIDSESPQIAQQSSSAPHDLGDGANLAYLIYTSGSTGQPKGVQISHTSLLNLIFWHHSAFKVTSADRATQMASPSFDAAVWEVWPYLTAGASIYFPGEPVRSQPELLRNWLVEKEISISFVPTPVAERMLYLEWPSKIALRILLTGADTLHRYPPTDLPFLLVNNYGPTECTVVATSGAVPSNQSSDLPSIGFPIANTQIYILDGEMRQVPTGSSGELHIGGTGLARGYLNRPDLSSQKFVPNPFSDVPGDRLYKTGDLARYLPDGKIAFLGRVDDQVKIRGYRVELSEITNVLNRHPAVRENIVIAREESVGEKRIVAYIVPFAGANPTNNELRQHLGQELPEYMLPAVFVTMDSLPLGTNGKVDRSVLPVPTDENIIRDEKFVAPRTPTEQRIASIVATLLGLKRIGVNDNFFLLGGNSLLATQVIARLREAFDVEVSLLTLFDHPTVAGIASEVEQLIFARVEALSEEEVQRLVAE